jgi:ABC-type phosphonate transport system ATPase subunit
MRYMERTPMIEVKGLTKRYGDVLAVDDLSFDVEPGLHARRIRRSDRRSHHPCTEGL